MNLIQIQEHLKDMPTQAIMAYANGQNPEVPPYMALGEMNRRKNMEQRAAQAPNASVKEKIESELAQQTALPGIGQGMNMRINPEGMPQPMPAAQPQMAPQMPKMDNPALAHSMPPQQMSQPGQTPGMAGGGLAGLQVDPRMFNYAPGGIVAFADPDNEQVVPEAADSEPATEGGAAGIDKLPVGLANKIMASRLQGDMGIPKVVDPEEIRKRYIAQHPEQAKLLNSLPGEALTQLATELDKQNQSQRSQFNEAEGPRGLAALSNALINAGEATRGQKGLKAQAGAAFGGFGKAFNASTLEGLERASKQQGVERAQTVEQMKLQSDIDNLQRAYAEGNVAKIVEAEKAVRARQEKIATMQGGAAKDVLAQYHNQKRDEELAQHHRALEKQAAINAAAAAETAKYARENRQTPEQKNTLRVMSILESDPDYKKAIDKRNDFEPGTPEYNAYQDYLDDKIKTAYAQLKLTPPTNIPRMKSIEKPKEKGFWEGLFGGSSDQTSPTKSKAVPFDQLPK